MRIAVAGGTGTVGRFVVEAVHRRGHEAVVLSRADGVDVITGHGLAAALHGTHAVIDVTNIVTLSAAVAREFFETSTTNLLRAEKASGVAHHVALSIVGIDRIDASYYAGKLDQERAVTAGEVPFTIARAAQFHEFAGQLLSSMRGPLAFLPKTLMRPVAAREVGEHLVDVAEAGPAGRAPDLVGPRDEELADVARRQLRFDGIRRRVLSVRLPGTYGAGLASGSLRGRPGALQGRMTFDEWLRSDDHRRPNG
ncbi:3-beta hydroxysteroid dehydrogenase [Agromyces atrinae]|uniref:SDR family oxidoreductase n=1 Tax=Agromyces atrinae TaxID=592376 RepID=UPI001F59F220|nr:3-beta hydroxysteroid dehydrogenase [Agromyces atrinae]MCI2958422.1 3-beta hydroxysteroid dehydrogenase [Agromyces atrinae]